MQQVITRIRLLALYALLLAPVIVYGAVHALQSSNNSPIDWVDDSFPERHQYNQFVDRFGPGDAVIASWPGCDWTDKRLDKLVSGLRKAKAFRNDKGEPLLHNVVCGRETLLQMTGISPSAEGEAPDFDEPEDAVADTAESEAPDALSQRSRTPLATAIERLRGTLIGKDGRTTCLIVTLNEEGLAVRESLVANLRRAIRLCCEVKDEDLHMAGPVVDGLSVDVASHASLTNFAGPSALVVFLICWFSLRSPLAGAVVFLSASFCQAVLLAVIYYTGQKVSALLIILPPLVQVLTVSGGIHLMNYYYNALEFLPPKEAAVDAFRKGWLPSVLSLGTTAMGTASLMVSGLEPIRLFGIYGTIGVLLAAATVLTVVPCSMILLNRNPRSGRIATAKSESDEPTATPQVASMDMWHRLATLLSTRNRASLIVLLGIMFVGAIGLASLQTSIRIETLFPPDSRIMQDYGWLEDQIGPLVPIEILVTFDQECQLNDRLKMDVVWQISNAMKKYPHVRATTSALTFFPPMPPMKSLPANMRSAMLNKAIDMARPTFEKVSMLRPVDGGEVWRITAHVSALEPLDYGEILLGVRSTIDAALESGKDQRPGVTITTSGVMPLVHRIQGLLLTDLFSSLMSALFVITLTMTIVEAGIRSGLIAMTSNLFPIVTAFGLMGWLQHPMDIGSVMTASIALGIAVDDTLHFLAFFRRMICQPGATRFSAVLSAYRHCGPAMMQTSVSCGLGLLVFAFSEFVPSARFAVLMSFLLMLALLGDLLLLPALLLSPAGRLFEPQPTAKQEKTQIET